jgi:hypothetical protein
MPRFVGLDVENRAQHGLIAGLKVRNDPKFEFKAVWR